MCFSKIHLSINEVPHCKHPTSELICVLLLRISYRRLVERVIGIDFYATKIVDDFHFTKKGFWLNTSVSVGLFSFLPV